MMSNNQKNKKNGQGSGDSNQVKKSIADLSASNNRTVKGEGSDIAVRKAWFLFTNLFSLYGTLRAPKVIDQEKRQVLYERVSINDVGDCEFEISDKEREAMRAITFQVDFDLDKKEKLPDDDDGRIRMLFLHKLCDLSVKLDAECIYESVAVEKWSQGVGINLEEFHKNSERAGLENDGLRFKITGYHLSEFIEHHYPNKKDSEAKRKDLSQKRKEFLSIFNAIRDKSHLREKYIKTNNTKKAYEDPEKGNILLLQDRRNMADCIGEENLPLLKGIF